VLHVWHPQMSGDEAATRKRLEVAAGAPARVQWTLAIRPEVKVRRAPVRGHGMHY
jgi:hypothetical protein